MGIYRKLHFSAKEGKIRKVIGKVRPDFEKFECPICACEDLPRSAMFMCERGDHSLCLKCLRRHINSADAIKIACPICQASAPPTQPVENVTDSQLDLIWYHKPKAAERIKRLRFQRCLETMGDIFFCPSPGCDMAGVLGPGCSSATNEMYVKCIVCEKCHNAHCAKCRLRWITPVGTHIGRTCEEYARFCQQKVLCSDGVTRKECPQCRAVVERTGGCDAMSCRCGHNWCWKCLGTHGGHVAVCPEAEEKFSLNPGTTPAPAAIPEPVHGSAPASPAPYRPPPQLPPHCPFTTPAPAPAPAPTVTSLFSPPAPPSTPRDGIRSPRPLPRARPAPAPEGAPMTPLTDRPAPLPRGPSRGQGRANGPEGRRHFRPVPDWEAEIRFTDIKKAQQYPMHRYNHQLRVLSTQGPREPAVRIGTGTEAGYL